MEIDHSASMVRGVGITDERASLKVWGVLPPGTYDLKTTEAHWHILQPTNGASITLKPMFTASTVGSMTLQINNGGTATFTFSPSVQFVKDDGTFQTTPNATLQSAGTDFIELFTDGTTTYGRVLR